MSVTATICVLKPAGKKKRLNINHLITPKLSILLFIHGILCPGANDIIEGLGGHSEVWPDH
ncbi:unnamed protein product [Fusarium graminearum]|uniref:Chromosome 2, complete genome n=1 Tax=Gibberella zeae (strain ATCC MYA-4620 / CBS 123657 / FGSC 9075 / NRRL 31084 / PH-1) TaxID=229533 RepID=A0A098DDU7_GIBZE|nr:unnamed protein product [Fusarium graminearum]CZS80424.1 unnamed protein product [Fusarium graminearum]